MVDLIDLRILSALQENCRMTNVELARRIGLAPSSMLERVRRLEEQGAITGYRAIVGQDALDYNIQAFISVTLSNHEVDKINSFEKRIGQLANVTSAYHTTGRFDYLLQVVARDLEHLGDLVKQDIAAIPGMGKVETFLVFSTIKQHRGLPIQIEQDKQEA
jgi:Lrp/AsnC family leucine-responsive transcriptional regulator